MSDSTTPQSFFNSVVAFAHALDAFCECQSDTTVALVERRWAEMDGREVIGPPVELGEMVLSPIGWGVTGPAGEPLRDAIEAYEIVQQWHALPELNPDYMKPDAPVHLPAVSQAQLALLKAHSRTLLGQARRTPSSNGPGQSSVAVHPQSGGNTMFEQVLKSSKVRRLLELAAVYTPQIDVPAELQGTLDDCIRMGLIEPRYFDAAHHPYAKCPSGASESDRVAWRENRWRPKQLVLTTFGVQNGEAALGFCRLMSEEEGQSLAQQPPNLTAAVVQPDIGQTAPQSSKVCNVLRLTGEVWHVGYQDGNEVGDFLNRGDSVFRHLARLLAEPNRRFGALEFYPRPPGAAPLPNYGRDKNSDAEAVENYRKELERLAREIKEAEDAHDAETATELREAFDRLTKFTEAEMKAGGRGRGKRSGSPSPAEKADNNLRMGMARLAGRLRGKRMPKLAEHVEKYIVNAECEWWYCPPPETSAWDVSRPELPVKE